MTDDHHSRELEARLAAARELLASAPRGSVAYLDALSAVRHLERVLAGRDDLPAAVCRHSPRRR